MPDFLRRFDDSGRQPRPQQVEFLHWLNDNWKSKYVAAQLPVGSGKSAIAKAISVVTNAHVITPSNVLIDQYTDTYPKDNYLKGKEHYTCHVSTLSCHDWHAATSEYCEGCKYASCRRSAVEGKPTFFNPASLYYAVSAPNWQDPAVMVVDEAHQLAGMIQMMSGVVYRASKYRFNDSVVNERDLILWLDDLLRRLQSMAKLYARDPQKLAEVQREAGQLRLVRMGFYDKPQNYAVWVEKGTHRGRPDKFLHIQPLAPPRRIVDQVLTGRKIIMMSGTLFESDVRELIGDAPYASIDLPSPIPKEQRLIHYEPMPFRANKDTPPERVAEYLKDLVKRHEGPAIIHVSYAWSRRLQPHLPGWLFNTPETKNATLEKFRNTGVPFVASGCAEGIDLPGGVCRLNIIPLLPFPNMTDRVVQKRMALEDGQQWYNLKTMRDVIQQAGRSTRGPDDWSRTIICDPNFARVYSNVKSYLPQSFREVIRWG